MKSGEWHPPISSLFSPPYEPICGEVAISRLTANAVVVFGDGAWYRQCELIGHLLGDLHLCYVRKAVVRDGTFLSARQRLAKSFVGNQHVSAPASGPKDFTDSNR